MALRMFLCKSCDVICVFFYFIVFFTKTLFVNSEPEEGIPEPLLRKIYESYNDALHIEVGTVSARRVFSENKQYDIHVMKLDEVNGNKRHNLMVKESNATNPLIYINNPVETKLPHAYLTYEEFKKVLTDRVKLIRQQFVTKVHVSITKPPNPKNLEKAKVVKEFKTFLDKLIKLQAAEIDANYKKTKNSTKKVKKTSPVFKIHTLQTDPEIENVTNITHATKPVITTNSTSITTELTTNEIDLRYANPENKPILRASEKKVSEVKKSTKHIPLIAVTKTTIPKSDVSETKLVEDEMAGVITESESTKATELTEKETESTTHAVTTTKITTTKRTTLGRPLVFMEEDEKQKEAEMQAEMLSENK